MWRLKEDEYDAIMKALRSGDRIELVPVKDGVRIFRIRRDEIKPNKKISPR